MPRSPLLNAIARIAKDYRIASFKNVSVETVRQWRDEKVERDRRLGVDRRAVLGGAAAAAAAALLPRSASAMLAQPTVAIIGGGIAGLNCALTLQDRGLTNVTVYEASTRLGGRMHSNVGYFDNGQVSEWCGELIDTNHLTIQRLAQRFGLPLVDLHQAEPAGSEDTYYFFNQYYPRAQAVSDFQPVYDALSAAIKSAPYPSLYNSITAAGRALDNTSVYDWIEQNVPGGHASPMGAMLDVAYTEELAVDARLQSSLNLIYLLGFQKHFHDFEFFGLSDERFHTVGGNDQIPLAVAGALGPSAIQRGWALTAIAKLSDGRYALTFSVAGATKTVKADYVVMALPFSVLRDLDYSQAGFDSLKNYTIQNLGMGRSGKLQMQFTSRLWNQTGPWPGVSNGNTYTDVGYQNSWDVTRAQAGSTGIMNCYTGGPVSLALTARVPYGYTQDSGVMADAQRFLPGLNRLFPGLAAKWNGKVASSVPHLDPFLKLSYSHWKIGQYQSIAGYEQVRQGKVMFAGEHTSVDFQGFMEGGAISGDRAANEIIHDL